jgi:hypothetical protein
MSDIEDQNKGGPRATSAAFLDPEMSVDVEEFHIERGLNPEDSLKEHSGYGLARLPAAVPFALGLAVMHDPIVHPTDTSKNNPAHALVLGQKTSSIARKLQRDSELIVAPTRS